MDQFLATWSRRGIAGALALLSSMSVALATPRPVYNIPITVEGQFYDGTSLTGYFSLNQYGYTNSAYSMVTSAGLAVNGSSAIPALTFSPQNGVIGSVGSVPNTIEVSAAYNSTTRFT